MKPFIGTAIVGNGRMLATIGSNGELHRLFWPSIDMFQQIHQTWSTILSTGFGDRAVRVDDEGNWVYSQEYLNDAAILKTEAKAKRGDLHVITLDFVHPARDIMVRRFEISNHSPHTVLVVFLYYAAMHLNEGELNNATRFDWDNDILYHFKQDTWIAVAGDQEPSDIQCGWCSDNSFNANLNGKEISMAPDGCQAWNLGNLEPGQSKIIAIYLAAGNCRDQARENIVFARQSGWNGLLQETSRFWETYLEQGFPLIGADDQTKKLHKRSVMVCKLLMNRDTGGIIAAPEFDESYQKSGGYGYCWARDAAFIAHAMLKAGYPEYARDFYSWAASYQDPAGGWPQRQYTNGQTAPGWGDQIDETGTVLWGICEFYEQTRDGRFIEEMWPAVVKAADFLMSSRDKETGLPGISFDLWEERLGVHAYSCAAVYAGLRGAGQIAQAIGETNQAIKWLEAATILQDKMLAYFWSNDLDRFIRTGWIAVNGDEFERRKCSGDKVQELIGPKGYLTQLVFGDDRADISLLGLTVPFGVVMPDSRQMRKTVEHLVENLTNCNVGGIHRYSQDHYIGGNPWVLTTIWLGMYEAAAGKWAKAAERLGWVNEHRTSLDFLPEQVECNTGETAWVVPLAWSHAMYLLLVNMMSEAKKL